MKAYTDIKQSRKLAEILPVESADMHYCFNFGPAMNNWWRTIPNVTKKDDHFELYPNDIQCWSLAALLEVLNMPALTQNNDNDWDVVIINPKYPDEYIEVHGLNPVDACVEMIVKLKEKYLL